MATAIKDALEVIAKIREGNLDQLSALPPLLNALESEIDIKTSISQLQEQFGSLEKTVLQSQRDLQRKVASLEDSLKRQADQLFLSDEEHKQMVKHVHVVLDSLEEYLRRHT